MAEGFGRARGRSRGIRMLQLAAQSQSQSQLFSGGSPSEPSTSEGRKSESPTEPAMRGRGSFRNTGVLVTKPSAIQNTVGDKGREMTLISNYFRLQHPTDLIINQYHVDFEPNVESSKMRRKLILQKKELFGKQYIFDGMSDLKTLRRLEEDDMVFEAVRDTDYETIKVRLRHTNEVPWGAFEMLRMYNTQMRRNLAHIGYVLLGRYYYDKNSEIKINEYGGVGIWRGVLTAIAQHDGGILMACDTIYKFVRAQTALDVLRSVLNKVGNQAFQDSARKELAGMVVMTNYNNRTYRIDDINFDRNPQYVFEGKSGAISLIDYYKQQYNVDIKDHKQPLIECLPSARDRRAGRTEKILLVPELCLMTGLTDEMRANFQFCKKIADVSRLNPVKRVENLTQFMKDLRGNSNVREEMSLWKLGFSSGLTEITARQLDPEKILMNDNPNDGGELYEQNKGDFMRQIRGKQMRKAVDITRWVVINGPKEVPLINDFVTTLNRVCGPMGVTLGKPKILTLENDRTGSFLAELKKVPNAAEMIVCVVPNNNKERYDSIKKLCCCEKAVASQVIVSRTISKKEMLMSVCTKIGIQMAVKLGAEAWALNIPPKNMMVVGYDTHHDGTLKGQSAGGFVASLNQSLTRWFSKVSYHKNRDEMSGNFATHFKDSLKRYYEVNGTLPDRVLIYRDGVGDGMIRHVYDYELKQIKRAIEDCGTIKPKLVFTIVTKRVNARFFRNTGGTSYDNPPPGTIIDTVVTRPERFDFYLVSQSVRQGTVAPTLYNIIEDESKWKPQNHQQLAYKLTHLYYNWPGTIRVPAPCQYAYKLAYLTGTSLHREPSMTLSNTLFYL